MDIVLKTERFIENGLTRDEVFYLMLMYYKSDIPSVQQSLIEKGYITRDGDIFKDFRITDKGLTNLESIILDSDDNVPKKDRTLLCLALEMQALFPKGSKEGGSSWKGSQREIMLKLQKWYKLYGTHVDEYGEERVWTHEEILNATKRYVDSFNGNYKFMRQLKYFILKFDKKIDALGKGYTEEVSDLATFLENTDTDYNNTEWQVDLK